MTIRSFTLCIATGAFGLALVAQAAPAGPILWGLEAESMADGSEATVVSSSHHVKRVGDSFQVTEGTTTKTYSKDQFRVMLLFASARAGAAGVDLLPSGDLPALSTWGSDPAHVGRAAYTSHQGQALLIDSRADGNLYVYQSETSQPEVIARTGFAAQVETDAARGWRTACCSNLKNLATACEMYASDHSGRYPKKLELLVTANYLKRMPTCPAAGKVTYSYQVAQKPDSFSLTCSGNNHAAVGLPANSPAYTAEQGLLRYQSPQDK